MSLQKGDIIRNSEYVSDCWYKGTKLEKTGVYPNNFVTLCSSKILPSSLATFGMKHVNFYFKFWLDSALFDLYIVFTEFELHSSYTIKTSEKLLIAISDKVGYVEPYIYVYSIHHTDGYGEHW